MSRASGDASSSSSSSGGGSSSSSGGGSSSRTRYRDDSPAQSVILPSVGRRSTDSSDPAPRSSSRRSSDAVVQQHLGIPVAPREVVDRVPTSRKLHWWDVAALVINKMVGTGIFTGPAVVVQATRNKSVAITLWALGFTYTLASTWLYLEYSRDLPYNGGELIYLDDTLSRNERRRLKWFGLYAPRLRLLAYTLYSFYFVMLYTTTTNSMQFARQVLIAVAPGDPDYPGSHQSLMRFIAVAIASVVCLFVYFSRQKSLWANNATAVGKLLLLLAVMAAGGQYLRQNGPKTADWTTTGPATSDGWDWTYGILTVFFSYHGWDNATLVAGEVPRFVRLRTGFVVGVTVVGVMYIILATLVGLSFSWDQGPPQNFMSVYFGNTDQAILASAILTALSATGSMISVTYTCTRVKQAIAWTSILPWSSFWRRSAPHRSSEHPLSRTSPEGGTILHWIVTVFFICVTVPIGNLSQAIAFSGNLLVYGHFVVEAAVGIGFALLYKPQRVEQLTRDEFDAGSPPAWLRPTRAPWVGPAVIGLVPAAFSWVVIVCTPIQPQERAYLWITLAVFGAAIVYWLCLRYNVLRRLGIVLEMKTHGIDDRDENARRCHKCHATDAAHRHDLDGYYTFIRRRTGAGVGTGSQENVVGLGDMPAKD